MVALLLAVQYVAATLLRSRSRWIHAGACFRSAILLLLLASAQIAGRQVVITDEPGAQRHRHHHCSRPGSWIDRCLSGWGIIVIVGKIRSYYSKAEKDGRVVTPLAPGEQESRKATRCVEKTGVGSEKENDVALFALPAV